MKTIQVNLGARAYPILIGDGILTRAAEYAADTCVIITNPTVAGLYGDTLLSALNAAGKSARLITIPDGEAQKNLSTVQSILDEMLAHGMGRDGGVIALGGGVIGDIAGFAAAIYMRGVPFLQAPTTLLAQVDAAIGGKTGVNHARGKNLIGAFHQPRAVIVDTATLASLPAREYRAGLAEVVKYGLLGDGDFFDFIEQNAAAINAREAPALQTLIERSAQIKADIVVADETEQSGQRALLNLGHTFAHALEAVSGYGEWLHGEAVAYGLTAAARLSETQCGFAATDTARICRLLEALQLPTELPDSLSNATGAQKLLAAMGVDKKNIAGDKRFILMRRIGEAYVGAAPDAAARAALAI